MSKSTDGSIMGQLQKLYFRIGEVSNIVGVEPHVLRYWESEFRSVRPQKSARGQRIYSRRDVETLLKVKELLYGQRFTIAGAKQRLREGKVELPPAGSQAESPRAAASAANAESSTLPTVAVAQAAVESAAVESAIEASASATALASNGASLDELRSIRQELHEVASSMEAFLRELDRHETLTLAR